MAIEGRRSEGFGRRREMRMGSIHVEEKVFTMASS
jgi:hypothetical protein